MCVPIIDHIDTSGSGPNLVADLAEEFQLNRIGVGAGYIEGDGTAVGDDKAKGRRLAPQVAEHRAAVHVHPTAAVRAGGERAADRDVW